MANTLTTNPLIITTAATISTTTVRPLLAKRIEWLTPVNIGDKVIAQDLTGNVIFEGTCEVASQSQILWSGPQKLTLPGKQASFAGTGNAAGSWQIATINSGTLLVWF
jgi:hypothetical protein